jgi:transcriptional regulator of acetoin/glycerol metabolism
MSELTRLEVERINSNDDQERIEIEVHSGLEPIPHKNTVAENILTFMQECKWRYKTLADKTGLDRAQVWRHANSKVAPGPDSILLYNQAFTKELKRPVSIS